MSMLPANVALCYDVFVSCPCQGLGEGRALGRFWQQAPAQAPPYLPPLPSLASLGSSALAPFVKPPYLAVQAQDRWRDFAIRSCPHALQQKLFPFRTEQGGFRDGLPEPVRLQSGFLLVQPTCLVLEMRQLTSTATKQFLILQTQNQSRNAELKGCLESWASHLPPFFQPLGQMTFPYAAALSPKEGDSAAERTSKPVSLVVQSSRGASAISSKDTRTGRATSRVLQALATLRHGYKAVFGLTKGYMEKWPRNNVYVHAAKTVAHSGNKAIKARSL